jgi:hypothetical protein
MLVASWKRARAAKGSGPSLWSAIGGGGEGGDGGDGLQPVPPSALGLSLSHSDTEPDRKGEGNEVGSYLLSIPENGSVAKIKQVAGKRGERPAGCGRRGEIHGLSIAAALRLQRAILSVDQARLTAKFFVALTLVAGEFQWPDVRKFLRRYRSRFERKWPMACAFWVKELTKKGTPHLHLVVLFTEPDPPSRSSFIAWNDDAWASSVKSSSEHHRRRSCRVDELRSLKGASGYLSSYLKKGAATGDDERQSECGKMWGIIGRKNLPVTWLPVVKLTADQGKKFQRIMRRLQRRKREFWLHSSISRDSLRSQGRPFVWRRISGKVESFNGERIESLASYVASLRAVGITVKRVRPACCRRVVVPLWSVDEGSQKWEKHGEEIHSFTSGWHFVEASTAMRLASFVIESG